MATQMEELSARKETGMFLEVGIGSIVPSSLNPRKHFDTQGLDELVGSIRQHGVIEPIVLRRDDSWFIEPGRCSGRPMFACYSSRYVIPDAPLGERYQSGAPSFYFDSQEEAEAALPFYEIICGERRWRASKIVGLETMPAYVRADVDDSEALELALIENLCRRDIDPIEEAQGYQKLMDMGYKQSEVAQKVNRSPEAVSNAIRLLKLPTQVLEHISSGKLTPSHGKALLSHADTPIFEVMAEQAIAGVTAKEIEKPTWTTARKLLESDQAIRLGYGNKFDECASCDHAMDFDGATLCVDPLCHAAKTQRKESEAMAKLEQKDILDVNQLTRGTYQVLRPAPAGCKTDCEHRRAGREYNSSLVSVCVNPGCYNKLKAAENRDNSKSRKEQIAELFAPAFALLDSREAMDKAVFLVCVRAMKCAPIDAVRDAIKRSGISLDIDLVRGYCSEDTHQAYEEIARFGTARAIAFVAEIELQEEARSMRSGSDSGDTKRQWLMGEDPLMGTFACPGCGKPTPEKSYSNYTSDGVAYCSKKCADIVPKAQNAIPELESPETSIRLPEEVEATAAATEPQKTGQSAEGANYVDSDGAVYFVGQGLGGSDAQWFTLKRKAGETGTHRVKSPALMLRDTREQAQADLDSYAVKHGLKVEVQS